MDKATGRIDESVRRKMKRDRSQHFLNSNSLLLLLSDITLPPPDPTEEEVIPVSETEKPSLLATISPAAAFAAITDAVTDVVSAPVKMAAQIEKKIARV
jgi:hypothetical protein